MKKEIFSLTYEILKFVGLLGFGIALVQLLVR